ncbi:MAG: CCA tRNA nucleotidyltransferase [Planctomycetaceae bacterium]
MAMPASDPQRDFAVDVVRRLQQAGFTALWAGGCVRDLLLGHPPDDYDVATTATPEQVEQVFGKRKTLAIGASFGVILVRGPKRLGAGDVEVATFRTEGPYLDGRRPEHVAFATPEEDARRRDFTINGMFLDPLTDNLHDYVEGRKDLDRRVVRAIGDPRARFAEDKLRMLRAVRITARFDFELDPATAAAIREMAPELPVVSGERIAQELKKMLVHSRRARAVRLADELNLLAVVLPELEPVLRTAGPTWLRTLEMLERLEQPRFELALAALLFALTANQPIPAIAATVSDICRRLRLSNKEREDTLWLLTHVDAVRGASHWPLPKLKRFLAEPLIGELLVLARLAALCGGEELADTDFCERYLEQTPEAEINPAPLISGDDLIALGLAPGATFRDLLERVRDAQLEGTVATREEAIALVKLWLSPPHGGE